ncbi:hypothetical protein EON62_06240, partial [archaeon]
MDARGTQVAVSNALTFSYDPPEVTVVTPVPVMVTDEGTSIITLFGNNFGRVQDAALYSEADRALNISVAGLPCVQPARVLLGTSNVLQCTLPADVPVGSGNLTVVVAGQSTLVPARSAVGSVFVACDRGFFGFAGESCLPCPVGATCAGFVRNALLGSSASAGTLLPNVSAAPVTMGSVQYDIGGIHTYPIPLPGFFNLNGSMASACPDTMVIPGRAVCISPCVPQSACVGDNYCAEGYDSAAPYFRCNVCKRGFYRRYGECVPCSNNLSALIIGFTAIGLVLIAAGYLLQRYRISPAVASVGVDFFQVISIFADSKVPWPPVIKQLYYILSSFNLNIDLIQVECLVPETTLMAKLQL